MKTIHKFPLARASGWVASEIDVSLAFRVLHVGMQGLTLCAWVLVDDTAPRSPTPLIVVPTGCELPDGFGPLEHVGSTVDSALEVWHVFVPGVQR